MIQKYIFHESLQKKLWFSFWLWLSSADCFFFTPQWPKKSMKQEVLVLGLQRVLVQITETLLDQRPSWNSWVTSCFVQKKETFPVIHLWVHGPWNWTLTLSPESGPDTGPKHRTRNMTWLWTLTLDPDTGPWIWILTLDPETGPRSGSQL